MWCRATPLLPFISTTKAHAVNITKMLPIFKTVTTAMPRRFIRVNEFY